MTSAMRWGRAVGGQVREAGRGVQVQVKVRRRRVTHLRAAWLPPMWPPATRQAGSPRPQLLLQSELNDFFLQRARQVPHTQAILPRTHYEALPLFLHFRQNEGSYWQNEGSYWHYDRARASL